MCASFHGVCTYFLNKINCPIGLRQVKPCSDATNLFPYGKPQNMIGICECGGMNYASIRTQQLLVDELIEQQIATNYLYLPFSNDPYTLTVSSSAFKQILYPDCTVPNV